VVSDTLLHIVLVCHQNMKDEEIILTEILAELVGNALWCRGHNKR